MKKFIVLSLVVLTVSACTSKITSPKDHAAFWNRTDASSALYMSGPKAQHMLHKDISSCVSEVKELSRLGTIRDGNPPAGIEMNAGLANKWQSPRGDGPLHTEFRDFNDFETCMNFKGWERTNYVRHDQIENSRSNYRTTIIGNRPQTSSKNTTSARARASGSYNN